MTKGFVIVSGGDHGYFPLLEELCLSVRRLDPEAPLALINGGFDEAQLNRCAELSVQVTETKWPTVFSEAKCEGQLRLLSNMWKPHLNRLFPDYETVIWIDGDAWLQTWDVIPLLLSASNKKKLAIVSQANRYEAQTISMRWLFRKHVGQPRNILLKNAIKARLPSSIVDSMALRATLNAGVYALHRDAPHWARMQYWQDECLKRGRPFTSDQLAMGIVCYHEGLPHETLPEWCNYHSDPWRYDTERNLFVDYGPPYEPVSVVHMAGQDEMRRVPATTIDMVDMNDKPIKMSLRYSEWPGRENSEAASRRMV